MSNYTRFKGFSLIELTITIISVLAAVAVPSYKHYVRKAQISKIFPVFQDFKAAAFEVLETRGYFTLANLGPFIPFEEVDLNNDGWTYRYFIEGFQPSKALLFAKNDSLNISNLAYVVVLTSEGAVVSTCGPYYDYGPNSQTDDLYDLLPSNCVRWAQDWYYNTQ